MATYKLIDEKGTVLWEHICSTQPPTPPVPPIPPPTTGEELNFAVTYDKAVGPGATKTFFWRLADPNKTSVHIECVPFYLGGDGEAILTLPNGKSVAMPIIGVQQGLVATLMGQQLSENGYAPFGTYILKVIANDWIYVKIMCNIY